MPPASTSEWAAPAPSMFVWLGAPRPTNAQDTVDPSANRMMPGPVLDAVSTSVGTMLPAQLASAAGNEAGKSLTAATPVPKAEDCPPSVVAVVTAAATTGNRVERPSTVSPAEAAVGKTNPATRQAHMRPTQEPERTINS